jgi:hypothetical protein
MPLMTRAPSDHLHGVVVESVMRWTLTTLTPIVRAVAPWLYDLPAPVLAWALLAATTFGMVWAGAAVLRQRRAGALASSPDMNSLSRSAPVRRSCYSVVATVLPSVFISAGVMPDVYYEAVMNHHRARPRRPRARSTRQAPDRGRAAQARRPAADVGNGDRRRRRNDRRHSSDSPWTVILVRPASAYRSMEK